MINFRFVPILISLTVSVLACSAGTTTGSSGGTAVADAGQTSNEGGVGTSSGGACSIVLSSLPTKDVEPYCEATLDFGEFGDLVAGEYDLVRTSQAACTGEVARGVLSITVDAAAKTAVIREHRESAGGVKKYDYAWKLDVANHVVSDAIACAGTDAPPTFPLVKGLFSYNSYGATGQRVFSFRAGQDLQLNYVSR